MRVPLSWLSEYVPLRMNPPELAYRLTMAGLETTYDAGVGAGWEGVVVGHVAEVRPHPNADRLRLVDVDLGATTHTVVCGAPNVAAGQKIAFAQVGARLKSGKTGEPMELTAAVIRGVESAGMVCSERELGLSDEHEGIRVLPDSSPVGAPLSGVLPSGDALEIEITANRGDLPLHARHRARGGSHHRRTGNGALHRLRRKRRRGQWSSRYRDSRP